MPASAYKQARENMSEFRSGGSKAAKWRSGEAAHRLVYNVHGTGRVGEGERRLRAERYVAVTSEVETPRVLLNQEFAEPLRSARLLAVLRVNVRAPPPGALCPLSVILPIELRKD